MLNSPEPKLQLVIISQLAVNVMSKQGFMYQWLAIPKVLAREGLLGLYPRPDPDRRI
jgi:hypothetical protein